VGKTGWDPLNGKAASALCQANEWQCKVSGRIFIVYQLFFIVELI